MKKLAVVITLMLAVGCSQSGCASTATSKRYGYIGLNTALTAANLIQDLALTTECGKPQAPPPPACVPDATTDKVHTKLVAAYKLIEKATGVVQAIPPSLEATPNAEVLSLITEIWTLVDEIRALFPAQVKTTLDPQIDALARQ